MMFGDRIIKMVISEKLINNVFYKLISFMTSDALDYKMITVYYK